MLDWISRIPWWVKLPSSVAGFLVSAFSSRLPEAYQDLGLWLGLVLFGLSLVALFWHTIGPKKKSALKSLPVAVDPSLSERDTKADRALAFIGTGNWDHTYDEFMGLDYENKGLPFENFRQAALDGKFRVWGKSQPSSPYHPIEKDYWDIWKLEFFSCLKGECKTEIATGLPRTEKRYDLMVSKAEIEKTWPPNK